MRARGAAAALLLAACSVDVEGARCRVPGATEDCPSGQACGNDGACSARALACEAAGTRCAPGAARCAGTDAVLRCAASDPACGAWEVEDCAAAGLACGERGAAAACECPPYDGLQLSADPAGGSLAGEAPFATGADAPAACRFRRLGEALAAAAARAAAAAEPAVVVPSGGAVFGDAATGETFPLAVAANVHLAGASEGAATVVRAEGATAAPLVEVQGWLSGVRVESVPTALAEGGVLAATGPGVRATCGAVNRPWIAEATVDGGGTLSAGVEVDAVEGACGATLVDVEVSGAAGPALAVAADPAAEHRVHVLGGALRDSAVGVRVTAGQVSLGALRGELVAAEVDDDAAVAVTGNAGEGVLLDGGGSRTIDAELLGATVAANGGTGVVLDSAGAASRLALEDCSVSGNGKDAAARRTYGGVSPRPVGGVLVKQTSVASLAFAGNRLIANAGDQLAFESTGAWSISPGSCPRANLFACVAAGTYAIGVRGGGSVDASFTVWPEVPWGSLVTGTVTAPSSAYCNGEEGAPALPPKGSCPDP